MLLLIIGSNRSLAQDPEPKSLQDVLISLENRFDIVFTYADENIQGVFVRISHNDLSLNQCLRELEKQTSLDFNRLNSRYITIRKNLRDVIVSGSLLDELTKNPVPGAVIYLKNTYTLSDNEGKFSIRINPEEGPTLIIRHTGYIPYRLHQSEWTNDSSIYELIPEIQSLEEVVINYIAKGIDKFNDGTIRLYVKNLEILPGLSEPDVLHTIQVLPGIQSINETVSDINIRGGTNDQNLVLWEGIKMYQTGHFFGLISAFNSHLVHKTEIVKNGTSASYTEGVSGTIAMEQQDYLNYDTKVNTGFNMISADAIANIPFGPKLSLILGARHSINNILITPTYRSYYKRAFEHTDVLQSQKQDTISDSHNFSFYDLSLKLLYDISKKDKIRFSFLNINNTIEYEESTLIRDTLFKKISSLNQASFLSGINYSRSWNEKHSTSISAYISNYRLEGNNVDLLTERNHLQNNEVTDLGIKVGSESKLSHSLKLLYGYQFDEIGIRNEDNLNNPGYYRDAKDVLRIHSLYTEVEMKELLKRLFFRFGVRANYINKFNELLLEPRAVLNLKLNKYLSGEVLAEKKSQYTTQLIDFQTDFLGIEKRRWALANNNSIPLIKSQQISLGMHYKRNNFLASIEAYKKKINGIITPSQGFQNQYQFAYSSGQYSVQGIELLTDKRFASSNIWVNYSLSKNDYTFNDFTPATFPNNIDIRHTLSLGGSYEIKNIELSGGFNYRTGKPFTRPSVENVVGGRGIIYEEANSSRLEDYVRLDISAKYNFEIKKIKGEFGASVWNILNRKNVINIFYTRNDSNEIEQITQHALGITPNINLRLNF